MSSHTIEDLTSCILDFQANMVRVTYRRKTTVVEPDVEPEHAAALNYIWVNSKVREEVDEDGEIVKWRLLGCQTEDLAAEFGEVGVLGLDCLVSHSDLEEECTLMACRNTLSCKTQISLLR